MALTPVAISLGSNLGDRLANLRVGWAGLQEVLTAEACSGVYSTAPLHLRDQPQFLNACCVGLTDLPPHELLDSLQRIERLASRVRSRVRDGPRTLDLDLLMYGYRIERSPELILPHPRMLGRAFVLIPLAEVAEDWKVPGTGATISSLASRISAAGVSMTEWKLPTDAEETD